jgi:hypothetical protein
MTAPIFKKFAPQPNTEFNEHPTNGLHSGQERADGRTRSLPHKVFFFRRVRNIAKVTISLIMFVCLSVRIEQLGSHRTDFH